MTVEHIEWFTTRHFSDYWINGFCLSLIANKSSSDVLDILHTSGEVDLDYEDAEESFIATIAESGQGTILLEKGGNAGAARSIAGLLSVGGGVAIVFVPFMGGRNFAYVEEAIPACVFQIDDPDIRWGTDPSRFESQLTQVGLIPVDTSEWEEEEVEEEDEEEAIAPSIARILQSIRLAEIITSVTFTQQAVSESLAHVSFARFHLSGRGNVKNSVFNPQA